MNKRRKAKAKRAGALHARVVPVGHGRAKLVFKRRGTSSSPFRANAEAARKPRKGSKARKAVMRGIADSARVQAAETSKASRSGETKRRLAKGRESAYKKRAKATKQWATSTKKTKKRVRVAFGPFKRARVKGQLSYGTKTPSGRIRKIPEWVIAGAPSAAAFADAKYDRARSRHAAVRERVAKSAEKRFSARLAKAEAKVKRLETKAERELRRIKEGRSIMSPNRKRRKAKGRKAKRRSTARKTYRRNAKRRTRNTVAKRVYTSGKRSVRSKRSRRSGKAKKRTIVYKATRKRVRKSRKKAKMARGIVRIAHTFKRGKKTRTKRYTMRYKAKRGSQGSLAFIPPGARRRKSSHRSYKFTANKRRTVRRRRAFRRNGAFEPVIQAFKTGAAAFGGFAAHRVITGALASQVGSMLPVPEAAKVPIVSVIVAGVGAAIAAKVLTGQNRDLVIAGIGISTIHQLVLGALRAADQGEAASYLAGIPTQSLTEYGMGAYELVGTSGFSGFGTLPYAQAMAGMGALPYAQALAGMGSTPYAARGNYLDRPSLGMGAYPEQALAAYPEQAAAGYGSYELTEEGGVLNGIGTDDASIERELNIADSHGSVGFGSDSIGQESILIPDGAQGPITDRPQLPLTSGIFSGNNFGTSFG